MKQLYGLIGGRLAYSLSPQIHSLIFKKLNIDGHYHLFQVKKEDLEDGICGLKALNIRGVNVTIPYKVEVMKYLHEISQEGQRIGAINTILIKGDKKLGFNTDYYGLEKMVDYFNIPIRSKRAVILGTGGGAKAVTQFLLDKDIGDISLVSRYKDSVALKYQDQRVLSYEDLRDLKDQDIIINCTPLGMYPFVNETPVDKEVLSKYQWAIDLNYNPLVTLFLEDAHQLGLKTANGLFMLVGQAVRAQEIWQGLSIPKEFTEDIYKEILSYN